MQQISTGVLIWWIYLISMGLFNIAIWMISVRRVRTDRRTQIVLSGIYVFGCAFRSFFPRADLQRICLFDSWISCVALGRSVATVAELCFITQLSFLLRELAETAGVRWVARLSTVPIILISIAEICSWYGVLTTNCLANCFEESLWTLSSIVLVVGLMGIHGRFSPRVRRWLTLAITGEIFYVAFMSSVDVPMYFTRWQAKQAAGAHYLSVIDGIRETATHWTVLRDWSTWHSEVPWMSFYFSFAVWLSVSIARVGRFNRSDLQA